MILEISIKDGMPLVDEALRRMELALRIHKRAKLIKIVHGYGSTGVGGKIRTAARARLRSMKAAGKIADFIPGEDFSMFDAATQKALDKYHRELTTDKDYGRSNNGVTIVIMP